MSGNCNISVHCGGGGNDGKATMMATIANCNYGGTACNGGDGGDECQLV